VRRRPRPEPAEANRRPLRGAMVAGGRKAVCGSREAAAGAMMQRDSEH
jgi:hypothetical protein